MKRLRQSRLKTSRYNHATKSSTTTIKAYAIYSPKTYVVTYYEVDDNALQDNSGTVTPHANNTTYYSVTDTDDVIYNTNTYACRTANALDGYTFAGWFISTTKLTGTISNYTKSSYVSALQVNAANVVGSLSKGTDYSDSNLGTSYVQNWVVKPIFTAQ